MLGVIVPVFIATTFCLTVPFIIIVADAAVLAAALAIYISERVGPESTAEETTKDLE
jgi:hypothetical protein